jgi:hypothetical protein
VGQPRNNWWQKKINPYNLDNLDTTTQPPARRGNNAIA